MSFPTRRVGYATVQNYAEDETKRFVVKTTDGGATWASVEMGRAVNKIRIVRAGAVTRAFAIGVNVHRLDVA